MKISLKGRGLALIRLFLHITAWNEQVLAGVTAVNLDHEDKVHVLRMAWQMAERSYST